MGSEVEFNLKYPSNIDFGCMFDKSDGAIEATGSTGHVINMQMLPVLQFGRRRWPNLRSLRTEPRSISSPATSYQNNWRRCSTWKCYYRPWWTYSFIADFRPELNYAVHFYNGLYLNDIKGLVTILLMSSPSQSTCNFMGRKTIITKMYYCIIILNDCYFDHANSFVPYFPQRRVHNIRLNVDKFPLRPQFKKKKRPTIMLLISKKQII